MAPRSWNILWLVEHKLHFVSFYPRNYQIIIETIIICDIFQNMQYSIFYEKHI